MKLKNIFTFIFLLFFLTPIGHIFAQTQNVGIIPANIWYSKDPFQEGDKIKIYTVVYNSDLRELSGTVIFFDNNIFLGKENFSIKGKSSNDVSIDWTVTVGDHIIFAKIENAKFLISTGKYEEVYLAGNKTEESKKTVTKKEVANISNNLTSSVSNIGNTIKENTPAIVTKTIDSTTNSLESIRTNVGSSLSTQKDKVQAEIDQLNKDTSKTKEADITIDNNTSNKIGNVEKGTMATSIKKELTGSNVLKPIKYVELFFLKVFSYIFANKILFYGLIVLIVFAIIRFIWRLIF